MWHGSRAVRAAAVSITPDNAVMDTAINATCAESNVPACRLQTFSAPGKCWPWWLGVS